MKVNFTAGQIGQVVNAEGKVVHINSPPSTTSPATESKASSANARLRLLLQKHLRLDSDLDAFCIDYFPTAKRRFTQGMDSTAKVNILLELEETASIEEKLHSWVSRQNPQFG